MKKRDKKISWAVVTALLALLLTGAYYSVSSTTDEMNLRMTGETAPDTIYAQAAVPTTTPLLYHRLPNEGIEPGNPLPGETPAITFMPATIASK
jgi:hypothetical protein